MAAFKKHKNTKHETHKKGVGEQRWSIMILFCGSNHNLINHCSCQEILNDCVSGNIRILWMWWLYADRVWVTFCAFETCLVNRMKEGWMWLYNWYIPVVNVLANNLFPLMCHECCLNLGNTHDTCMDYLLSPEHSSHTSSSYNFFETLHTVGLTDTHLITSVKLNNHQNTKITQKGLMLP